jgi:hypothetical protein
VPLEHALTRYAITVALVWIALSAVVMLVESTGPRPALQQQSADDLEEEAGRT